MLQIFYIFLSPKQWFYIATLCSVTPQLSYEVINAIKAALITKTAREKNGERLIVKVTGEIKEMGLHSNAVAKECWAGANIRHAQKRSRFS